MNSKKNDSENFLGKSKTKAIVFITNKIEYIVAVVVCAVMICLSFTDAVKSIEYSYYDTYLALKPELPQSEDLLMVCIDDMSIEEIGTYPWSRDIIADMMFRFKEFGAKTIVFDIEYLNPSSFGVNPSYVQETLPTQYSTVQAEVQDTLYALGNAVTSQSIPASQAESIAIEMTEYIGPMMNDLYDSITSNILRDNDQYFAKSLRYFGNAFVTINSSQVNTLEDSKEAVNYAYDNFLYSNVEDLKGYIAQDNAIERKKQSKKYGLGPALLPILKNSQGGGFPNIVADKDGVRRRFELLSEYNGKYVAQLIFDPLLKVMQPEKIVRNKNTLVLKNAYAPNGKSTERRDITIPLDDNGNVLINWLNKKFPESFRIESIYFLRYIDEIEETIIKHIRSIYNFELKTSRGYLGYHDVAEYLLYEYEELNKIKMALFNQERNDHEEYFERRKTFFEDVEYLIKGDFDQEIYNLFEEVRNSYGDETLYQEIENDLRALFSVFASDLELYKEEHARLTKTYNGSFCIIGNNAVGTTDLGTTPFESYYPNVGTHANLYNTIVNEAFITPVPHYISIVLSFLFSILFAILFRRLKTLNSRFIVGVLVILTTIFGLYTIFVALNIYIESFIIIMSLVLSFILITVSRFILSEKDKTFLKKAFSTYLSSDIIDEIIKDPTKLKLGGQEKELTAIFTDVKSFSTLSEKVTPTQLVSILNKYLSRMSDIVLDHKGTIDKFEGDAIIAFYGAPVDNPEHAKMALLSAIRMKQAEIELNKVLVESGEAPNALLTRIGINSGPMVVGNMGTDAKMNYTIMGNDVNLAARLEGVNKVYGTWILASEFSFNKAGPGFLGRRLDKVRVVGINTPVQLYNVMGVMEEMSQQTIDGIGVFHDALDLYLAQEFEKSIDKFNEVLKILPEDSPTLVYLERATKLIKTGVPDGWDGVVNMTSK